MFIREVRKRLKGPQGDDYEYVHHRLVESIRTAQGPRQKVVLNLGTLEVAREKFKTLANMIEALVYPTAQSPLFDDDPELVTLARHFAEQVLRKRIQDTASATDKDAPGAPKEVAEKILETIDVNSITNSQARTIGAEHIALAQAKQLEFLQILEECGLDSKQQKYSLAQVCARMVHPSSERETARWLRETSGLDELLGTDFSRLSDSTLHRTADLLLQHKDTLEKRLAETTRDLFSLNESLILYDLTNTYFESNKRESNIARHGRSKEKRSDCPIVTLGLVVDAQGFPKRSEIFEGNVHEGETLWRLLDKLCLDGTEQNPRTVVIDAGIASESNLARLREDKRFEYVAISRKKKFPEDLFAEAPTQSIELSKQQQLKVRAALHNEELFLLCESPEKAERDKKILDAKKKRFESGLSAIAQSLLKPRGRKGYAGIMERIGRLKERHKIGHLYTIKVVEENGQAKTISWTFNGDSKHNPGEYLIRTSRVDLHEQEVSAIHRTLTMIESAFRWLKSDLGLRPNYHQRDGRMKAHIFITVLAYFVLAPILNKLGWGGNFVGALPPDQRHSHQWTIPYGWHSVVHTMQSQVRVTTSSLCADGQRLDVRTTLDPTAKQTDIYRRLKISSRPLRRIIRKHGRTAR